MGSELGATSSFRHVKSRILDLKYVFKGENCGNIVGLSCILTSCRLFMYMMYFLMYFFVWNTGLMNCNSINKQE